MKKILFIGVFLILQFSLGSVGLACGADGKSEAQFFGRITNLNISQGGEAGEVEHYTYQIKFDESQTLLNPNCPLDIQLASRNTWWVQGLPLVRQGQTISGVLIFDSKTNIYNIE